MGLGFLSGMFLGTNGSVGLRSGSVMPVSLAPPLMRKDVLEDVPVWVLLSVEPLPPEGTDLVDWVLCCDLELLDLPPWLPSDPWDLAPLGPGWGSGLGWLCWGPGSGSGGGPGGPPCYPCRILWPRNLRDSSDLFRGIICLTSRLSFWSGVIFKNLRICKRFKFAYGHVFCAFSWGWTKSPYRQRFTLLGVLILSSPYEFPLVLFQNFS